MKLFFISLLSLSMMGFTLSNEARETVGEMAIQHNGRIKPFDTFARETLRSITGSDRVGSEDPVATILSILAEPEQWQDRPLISVPFVPLREKIGLGPKTKYVSYNQLVETRRLMRMLPTIVEKQGREEKLSMLEQETMDLFDRFVGFSNLLTQKLNLVPPPSGMGAIWLPILEPAAYPQDQQLVLRDRWTAFIDALRAGDSKMIDESSRTLVSTLKSANPSATPVPWRLHLEVLYNRLSPFKIAQIFYLLAAVGLLIGYGSCRGSPRGWAPPPGVDPPTAGHHRVTRSQWSLQMLGMGALWIGFIIHAAGIAVRVILGGRPPVSNFYETMLWLPFVAVAISLVLERIYRAGFMGLASSMLAVIVLALADVLPLEPHISPVVAVLRSNLWLTVHVLTVVASYGALSLATGLAHIYGWVYLVRGDKNPALDSLGTFLYRGIQVGVVLLASGVMLGAVWANASWGRYWGWDPKETWALITLLWFLAVLHGRFAGWLKDVAVAVATIVGFFLLLMTYYGVSFYLVGLHSYAGGHAKPLPPLLIVYLIAELAFMALVILSAVRRKQPAS